MRTLVIRHLLLISTVAVAGGGPWGQSRAAEGVTLEVVAGKHDRQGVPLAVELPPSLRGQQQFTLVEADSGRPVPVQVDRCSTPTLRWILRDKLAAGQSRRWRLRPAASQPVGTSVTVADDGQRLVAKIGARTVLAYNHAVVPSPLPKEPYYAKSGYIHPVYSPSGRIVTDDFNPDHAHQHGIMFAWRKLTCEGRTTNGWEQKDTKGRVHHVGIDGFGGGPVFGFFTVRLDQLDLTAPGGPAPILNETWRVRIDNLTDRFAFELEAVQTAARSPVTIDEMHYGGLMVRGARGWNKPPKYAFLTSEGRGTKDGNHTRPLWVDLCGPIDAQATGIVSLAHTANFRFPQPVRLHPTMPYFCFTPAFLGSFTIEPGKPYTSRYRFVVHDGPLSRAEADRLWADYVDPPRVRIVP